jgi:hypothetical protein
MIAAVLFDPDETLFNRTTSLVAFLASQYSRFAEGLSDVSFEVWQERFLALDAGGYVRKSVVHAPGFRYLGSTGANDAAV